MRRELTETSMTKVQAKALKIWGVILWTALWCWVYGVGHGEPLELLPEVSVNLLLFCLAGWSWPWGVAGLWRMTQERQKQRVIKARVQARS